MEIDNNIRKKNVKNIILKFKKINKSLSNDKLESISANIEAGVLRFSLDYVESNNSPFLLDSIYQEKLDNIVDLLNSDILSLINKNKIDPKQIASMSEKDLNPNKFSKITKKNKKIKEIEESKSTVTVFQCPKCKSRNSKVKELQLERADEPYDIFIECLDCGFVVKQ
jgi:DNA-directed RNA polymerase subunit M/transcription elongation factor TFIIS